MAKFDTWISRLSQIAQVGLFALAVFGFFYTVVPLYQKEVLSEVIAKKELKLSELQDKIHAYNTEELFNRVEGFIMMAGIKCTGMLEDPEFQKRMNYFLKGNIPGIDPATKFIVTNPTNVCLQQLYEDKKPLNGATQESRIKFEEELNKIAKGLEKIRKHIVSSGYTEEKFYEIIQFRSSMHYELSRLRVIEIEAMREE